MFARLAPPVEEEPTVDQPSPPHSELDYSPLLVVVKPAVEEVGPSCSKPTPSALIFVEEPAMERLGSLLSPGNRTSLPL